MYDEDDLGYVSRRILTLLAWASRPSTSASRTMSLAPAARFSWS